MSRHLTIKIVRMQLIFESDPGMVANKADFLSSLSREDYCYLTTTGRVTGNPHEIEIWFGTSGSNIYLLSGGGLESDWVKNLMAEPQVEVRIGKSKFKGQAKLIRTAKQEKPARELLAAKYYGWKEGKPLNNWARTAIPVAISLSTQ